MTYQIMRIIPVYCAIRDGHIGDRQEPANGYHYETLALARKIAGRLYDEAYEGCSDDSFRVVVSGGSAFNPRDWAPAAPQRLPDPFDEMPF